MLYYFAACAALWAAFNVSKNSFNSEWSYSFNYQNHNNNYNDNNCNYNKYDNTNSIIFSLIDPSGCIQSNFNRTTGCLNPFSISLILLLSIVFF